MEAIIEHNQLALLDTLGELTLIKGTRHPTSEQVDYAASKRLALCRGTRAGKINILHPTEYAEKAVFPVRRMNKRGPYCLDGADGLARSLVSGCFDKRKLRWRTGVTPLTEHVLDSSERYETLKNIWKFFGIDDGDEQSYDAELEPRWYGFFNYGYEAKYVAETMNGVWISPTVYALGVQNAAKQGMYACRDEDLTGEYISLTPYGVAWITSGTIGDIKRNSWLKCLYPTAVLRVDRLYHPVTEPVKLYSARYGDDRERPIGAGVVGTRETTLNGPLDGRDIWESRLEDVQFEWYMPYRR